MERHQVYHIFRIAWPITVADYVGAWVLVPPLGNVTRGLSLLEKYERFLVVQVAESQEYRDNETTSALPLYSYICYVCLGSFFFSYLR